MDRRKFLKSSSAVLPGLLLTGRKRDAKAEEAKAGEAHAADAMRAADDASAGDLLFPKNVSKREWVQFPANGFSKPACGVVYGRNDYVPHGMPLGGVATGCMDI